MAGRIPQSFINDLLARTDIVDVIDARVPLKKAGRNYQARCPFHEEKTPSFSVSPDKQFYYCFGCQASGTALTFLMEFDRLEFVEAVETLARMAGVEVPREGDRRPAGQDHSGIYAALARAERLYRAELRKSERAVAYLKNRGLTGLVARDFGIGYAPDGWQTVQAAFQNDPGVSEEDLLGAGLLTRNEKGRVYDRFRDRIMFPIRDTRGRVIGFGGRVLGPEDGPKYLNSPETPVFHKGRELYGLFEARSALRRIEQLIVVEGYMDVVALSQAGIANAVASLGTSTTGDHFHKLYRYCEEVVCCFDGDAAGRRAAWKALENALPTLTDGRQLKFMFLPEGEDPDSLVRKEGRAAFLRRVTDGSPAIEYLFTELSEGLDLHQLDDQARLASLVMPYIEKVPDGVLKQLMRHRLSRLTGLGTDAAPAVARPRMRARAPAPDGALSPLTRRLLSCLLRVPESLGGVEPAVRAAVAGYAADDVFAEIVTYVDQNPGVDRSELVGRWAGQPVGSELAALAAVPHTLSEEAVARELAEGLASYVAAKARDDRRRLLRELKEAPSAEKLRTLQSLIKGDTPHSAPGSGSNSR
ncbi:MAG: DNA primase [Pseudomonadales bacterium]|jgi:DNA primase